MLNFDQFVAIDWSGARAPLKSRAITLASCSPDQQAPQALTTPLSRQDIFDYLAEKLVKKNPCLVGIDANFGYPMHVFAAQLGAHYSCFKLWAEIDDICTQAPNFFGGHFWQHPKFEHFYWVQGKQPSSWAANTRQRQTDIACSAQGLGHPESPFKLIGTKQVGCGGLAAMRLLHQLKQQFGDRLCVWPFENTTAQTSMVLVEIYPRLFLKKHVGQQKIRHISQLNHVLGTLDSHHFSEINPLNDHLTDAIVAAAGLRFIHHTQKNWPITPAIAAHEGWIFGVPHAISATSH